MRNAVGIAGAALLLDGRVTTLEGGPGKGLELLVQGLPAARSMDRVCQAATALAGEALADAPAGLRQGAGVFFGSGYGTYPSNLDHLAAVAAGEPASPAVFSWTQPNIPAAWISISYNLEGETVTRSDGVLGGSKAVTSAVDFLEAGLAAALLAGAVSTDDPRVSSALDRAAGPRHRAPRREGGGFLFLCTTPETCPAMLTRVEGAFDARGLSWRQAAESLARETGAQLVLTARPGMNPGGELPPGVAFQALGDRGGDLQEGAGPAALALAALAVTAPVPDSLHRFARRRVLVADRGYCGREGVFFLVEAARGA